MTRYYGLVLVPGNPPTEEACRVAADKLLDLYEPQGESPGESPFDWFLQPDDIAPDDGVDQGIWPVPVMMDQIAALEVEAILTPDGQWHDLESHAHVSDDEAWVQYVRSILQEHQDCLALKHVFHI